MPISDELLVAVVTQESLMIICFLNNMPRPYDRIIFTFKNANKRATTGLIKLKKQ